MAISMAAGKASIDAFKANPRRVKLLKPAVMLAVTISLILVIDDIFTTHIIEQYKIATSVGFVPDPNRAGSGWWYELFSIFSFLTVTSTCLYLAGETHYIKGKNPGNSFKGFATATIPIVSAGTLVACFLLRHDVTSLYVEIHRPLVIIAAIVVPITMLVMEAVERRLLKTIESRRAGSVDLDEPVRLQMEQEMQRIK